jgi:hypothetical protein
LVLKATGIGKCDNGAENDQTQHAYLDLVTIDKSVSMNIKTLITFALYILSLSCVPLLVQLVFIQLYFIDKNVTCFCSHVQCADQI